ncbi:MAG: pimeloyl-ACP methyl ester carboxylesterase [Bacteroidia bacterium]|jgi:pimeloyl-ACP methyl ester carboxylesterase
MASLAGLALVACSSMPAPDLERLYRTSADNVGQPPVILVHGAFGARLCDESGEEHWPGGISGLLFSDYRSLQLPSAPAAPVQSGNLTPCGMTDTVAGQDFYGRIEATLTGPGGYVLAEPGQVATQGARHFYRFIYDWRRDNASTAAQLDAFVEQIRADHGDPGLKVDIVAHSMGGLVSRYWLRYGVADVLDDNDFPVSNAGGKKVRKVVLVGTPSLGSTSALQQLIAGADFAVNTVPAEVLLTFPSGFQLMPHPIIDPILGSRGEILSRDHFDVDIWRDLEWGAYDPALRKRLVEQGWNEQALAELEAYVHRNLERARRFVWSLTVKNEDSPYELVVFGGDCVATPARILIEDIGEESHVRLWPDEIKAPHEGVDYESLMLEPGDGAVTKASLLGRAALDPSIPRHRFSNFPLDYPVMFCEDHSRLPGNITFQDNLLHILLSR